MPYIDDDYLDELDQQSLYDDKAYGGYETTFYERLDDDPDAADTGLMEEDLTAEEGLGTSRTTTDGILSDADTSRMPEGATGFGERIDSHPYVGDPLETDPRGAEADTPTAETTGGEDKSLVDKAKDKVSEWTGNDKK